MSECGSAEMTPIVVENGIFICDVVCFLNKGESVVVVDDLIR
jgi:hypothetical protein